MQTLMRSATEEHADRCRGRDASDVIAEGTMRGGVRMVKRVRIYQVIGRPWRNRCAQGNSYRLPGDRPILAFLPWLVALACIAPMSGCENTRPTSDVRIEEAGSTSAPADIAAYQVPDCERIRVAFNHGIVTIRVFVPARRFWFQIGKRLKDIDQIGIVPVGSRQIRVGVVACDLWDAQGSLLSMTGSGADRVLEGSEEPSSAFERDYGNWWKLELHPNSFSSAEYYFLLEPWEGRHVMLVVQRVSESQFEIKGCWTQEDLVVLDDSPAQISQGLNVLRSIGESLASLAASSGLDVLVVAPGFISKPWDRDIDLQPYAVTVVLGEQPGRAGILADPYPAIVAEHGQILLVARIHSGTTSAEAVAPMLISLLQQACDGFSAQFDTGPYEGMSVTYWYQTEPTGPSALETLLSSHMAWQTVLFNPSEGERPAP